MYALTKPVLFLKQVWLMDRGKSGKRQLVLLLMHITIPIITYQIFYATHTAIQHHLMDLHQILLLRQKWMMAQNI